MPARKHPAVEAAQAKQHANAQASPEPKPTQSSHGAMAKANEMRESDTHDQLLHQASGTVHQVPAKGTHTADQGSGINVDTHGHSHANKVGTFASSKTGAGGTTTNPKKKRRERQREMHNRLRRELRNNRAGNPFTGGGGLSGLEGASAIGATPKLGGSSTSGTGASTGTTSPLPIIIGVLVLGIGGFLLYHKIHKAGAEEKNLNRTGNANG
jgi:LPXTG-motif cell wall-anchored protein